MLEAFNGGPDNRPARRGGVAALRSSNASFNGGPDNRPARQYNDTPGQRREASFNGGPDNRPARPSQHSRQIPTMPTFNGGPDNRPARPWLSGSRHVLTSPFNGGPDNRPARPGLDLSAAITAAHLQWRAGQSSGQTVGIVRFATFNKIPSMEGRTIVRPDPDVLIGIVEQRDIIPSMEGRTIVRPDLPFCFYIGEPSTTFNGGPDNRPARPPSCSEVCTQK